MHAIRVLEVWLRRNCSFMHLARLAALVKVTDSVVYGGKATLAELGRGIRNDVLEKHNVKCADRLVGNGHLGSERLRIYRALAHWLLSTVRRPWIIVDWSDVELGHEYLMLKAAVPVGGRAVSIYEEVHPLRRYNSPKTHRRFLERLARVVPAHCQPIIITDAGFRGPWFKVVESLGWDWIGRVRNVVKFSYDEATTWKNTTSLYRFAGRRPWYVGRCWLSSKQPYACYLHLYRSFQRGPGRPRKRARKRPGETRARRHAREPWLLATSLSPRRWSAHRVVRAYEKRMQIEETFRDLKSHRWGYGLQYARSRSSERLANLLLVTTLAIAATWLAGLAVRANGWARHFQANTVKDRPVLSVFFLGRRVLKSTRLCLQRADLWNAAHELPALVEKTTRFA
jgi:Transposase DDE domain